MTLAQSKALKVGDRVALPDGDKQMSTEVLSINRAKRTMTVLLGGSKPLSYRRVWRHLKKDVPFGITVGMSKPNHSYVDSMLVAAVSQAQAT